jgi:ABC-type uncharacterized transport system ATPase subunit
MRVTVKDVTKRFGTTIALENVSLEVGDGELVGSCGTQWVRQDYIAEIDRGL